MLPTLRHRLLIAATILFGTVPWLVLPSPIAAEVGSGATMLFTNQPASTTLMRFAAMMLPALTGAILVATVANRLAGVFVVSTVAMLAVGLGGSINGWMTYAQLPSDFQWLVGESLLWLAMGGITVAGIFTAGAWLGNLRTNERPNNSAAMELRLCRCRWRTPLAMLLCAAMGAAFAETLVRSDEVGQVLTGIVLAFLVASALAHLIAQQPNPLAILLAPMLVAPVLFGWLAQRFPDDAAARSAIYTQSMPGLAFALPGHFATAGVVGCSLGLAMAQFILAASMSMEHDSGEPDVTVNKST